MHISTIFGGRCSQTLDSHFAFISISNYCGGETNSGRKIRGGWWGVPFSWGLSAARRKHYHVLLTAGEIFQTADGNIISVPGVCTIVVSKMGRQHHRKCQQRTVSVKKRGNKNDLNISRFFCGGGTIIPRKNNGHILKVKGRLQTSLVPSKVMHPVFLVFTLYHILVFFVSISLWYI